MYNHPEYMTDYARHVERWARKRYLKKMLYRFLFVVVVIAGLSIW